LLTTLLFLAFIDTCGSRTDIPQIGCKPSRSRTWLDLLERSDFLPAIAGSEIWYIPSAL